MLVTDATGKFTSIVWEGNGSPRWDNTKYSVAPANSFGSQWEANGCVIIYILYFIVFIVLIVIILFLVLSSCLCLHHAIISHAPRHPLFLCRSILQGPISTHASRLDRCLVCLNTFLTSILVQICCDQPRQQLAANSCATSNQATQRVGFKKVCCI